MNAPNRTWGPWTLDLDTMHLVVQEDDFSLADCETTRSALEGFARIAGKGWATPELLGHLAQAIDDLVGWRNIASGERLDVERVVQRNARGLDWDDAHASGFEDDVAGGVRKFEARSLYLDETEPVRVLSMHDMLSAVVKEAKGGPTRKEHGPWRYDADRDWLYREGHAWGLNLSQVDKPEDLVSMMDHLEGKSFCTPQMLGEFWVAVRHWQRAKEIGLQ